MKNTKIERYVRKHLTIEGRSNPHIFLILKVIVDLNKPKQTHFVVKALSSSFLMEGVISFPITHVMSKTWVDYARLKAESMPTILTLLTFGEKVQHWTLSWDFIPPP